MNQEVVVYTSDIIRIEIAGLGTGVSIEFSGTLGIKG